jgi:hypothetical protein
LRILSSATNWDTTCSGRVTSDGADGALALALGQQ